MVLTLRVNSGMPRSKPSAVSRRSLGSAAYNTRLMGCGTSVGSVATRRGAFQAAVSDGLSNAVPCKLRSKSQAAKKASTRMCGIIGVFKHDGNANVEIYEGLLMLQHRGQDSAGMVTTDGTFWCAPLPSPPSPFLSALYVCIVGPVVSHLLFHLVLSVLRMLPLTRSFKFIRVQIS